MAVEASDLIVFATIEGGLLVLLVRLHRNRSLIAMMPGNPTHVQLLEVVKVMWGNVPISSYPPRYWFLTPFPIPALDIKSYAMAVLGTEYRESGKRNMPAEWFDKLPHTHVALDDAKGQGVLFCNILAARTRLLKRTEPTAAPHSGDR
jgi:hypothetical protein